MKKVFEAIIYRKKNKKNKRICILFYVIAIAILVLGFMVGTRTGFRSGGSVINKQSPLYGSKFPGHYYHYFGWFDIIFKSEDEGWCTNYFSGGQYWGEKNEYNPEYFVLFALCWFIILVMPIFIWWVLNKQEKNTTLYIDDNQIYGTYSKFLLKKNFSIPINKIDNVVHSESFFDKIRTGKTICICSASNKIKVHFIQNAEDIIQEWKYNTKLQNDVEEKKKINITDELREYKKLLDDGVITQEEFDKKKKGLLKL